MNRFGVLAAAAAVLLLASCTSSTSGQGSHAPATSTPPSTPSATGTPPAGPSSLSSSPPSSALAPVPHSGPLNGFRVADLTFVGRQGWALGTVGCTQGSGRCTAIGHSTDGGASWRSIVAPAVHVSITGIDSGPCADPCVQNVRFATPAVGYLFGGGDSRALFMTTDGGRTWRRQSGGADALESLDGNVIRVDDSGGCPPGCRYTVQTAAIGSSHWRTVTLPGTPNQTTGVTLARTGSHAYLIAYGHPAGGAQNARSTLWTSADDGAHWTDRAEPCPQGGGAEVDSVDLTSAPDGSVAVLCRVRDAGGGVFTATSTDGGAHFRAGSRSALGSADITAFGAASSRIVLVSSDETYRSTDGGRHFARLSANSGSSPGALGWLGFASSTVGHGISVDRTSIWTTTDGGRDWSAGRLR